jgi:hypothetical protein
MYAIYNATVIKTRRALGEPSGQVHISPTMCGGMPGSVQAQGLLELCEQTGSKALPSTQRKVYQSDLTRQPTALWQHRSNQNEMNPEISGCSKESRLAGLDKARVQKGIADDSDH